MLDTKYFTSISLFISHKSIMEVLFLLLFYIYNWGQQVYGSYPKS